MTGLLFSNIDFLTNHLKDKKKEEKKDEISLEDLIEKERAALGAGTKVTLDTFLAWKKRKLREREDTASKENTRKKAEFKAGRSVGVFLNFYLLSYILWVTELCICWLDFRS